MNCAIQENSGDRGSEGVEGKVIMVRYRHKMEFSLCSKQTPGLVLVIAALITLMQERPQTAVFSPWLTAQGRGKQLTFRRVCQILSGGRCSW
mmetsp:Transcript_17971/g.23953  ORF Transcript_17971/g.23953 Transcript_17971/m.23953 type:complete len:92 (+) Transcript_17971:93-368(+)